jgi:hypothetical protein
MYGKSNNILMHVWFGSIFGGAKLIIRLVKLTFTCLVELILYIFYEIDNFNLKVCF